MIQVFVDTIALLALWDERDQWHHAAESAFIHTYEENWILVTSTCVLLECGNAVARKAYRDIILDFRGKLLVSKQLIEPEPIDFENAWTAFSHPDAADAGIVDLVSFEVMRRLGITQALTNDEHFRAAGFQTLM